MADSQPAVAPIDSLVALDPAEVAASHPTADALVAAARAMRPILREKQSAHEALGGYDAQTHEAFLAAGFYLTLQPERYGGYGLGIEALMRIAIEISRGDPGVGWSFVLGAGHTFHVGSFYGEAGQAELFGNGPFIAPGRTIPHGRAERVDGGWRVTGTWDYCSGSMWSTHALVVGPAFEADGSMIGMRMYALPRADYTILDDWGGDQTLGMRASSSNSIRIDAQFVPEHLSINYDFREFELGGPQHAGFELHRKPDYIGRTMTYFNAELVATQIGAAWAALDEYEALMAERMSSFPPRVARREAPEYHRWFGKILALVDSAETLYLGAVRQYVSLAELWMREGVPFTPEQDGRLRSAIQTAARLANEAVELAFTSAGTSSAARGSRMQKYYRDVATYKTHIAAQWDVTFGSLARYHFGGPLTF